MVYQLVPYEQRPWWLRWVSARACATIGAQIYTPQGSAAILPMMLDHELVHVAQWERYGWWFAVVYLAGVPGFAPGCYILEREAYLANMRHGWTPERCAEELCSAKYLWPWPRRYVLRYFEQQRRLTQSPDSVS